MKLEKIEQATARTGQTYNKLTIDGKNYNFWGEIKDLKVGDEVLCEFETKGKFTNLKGIDKVTTQKMQPQASNEQNKNTTMYVSYVKDLVINGKTAEEAIEIIKKAKKEFS